LTLGWISAILKVVYPIVLQFGRFTITSYGLMVALGFAFGLWTASRRGPRGGLPAEKVLDLGPWLIVGAIVGARLLYVITFWQEQFAGKPLQEIFMVWRGGLVYYGGLVGASLACILYVRLKHLSLWKMADILAPSIALGHVFGRIGCLLNGCCYGRPCTLPWAIRFPPGNAADAPTTPVHPTEIYESLLNLGLYAGLVWLFRRKKFDGQVFGVYLVCYALLRSFVELFRGDYPAYQKFFGGQVTPAQFASMFILPIGLLLLIVLRRPSRSQEPVPGAKG
jgi:phosphatidylglycerol:prolipoprotein diacylglycerol transferase